MSKSIDAIHRELGFERGAHYHDNTAYPGGYGYSDAAVLELGRYLDQIKDSQVREYIRGRIAGAKARQKDAADREKAKREQQERDRLYQEARQREVQQKQDDAIRARIKRANPYATPEQVEALLPKVREAEMLKRTLEGEDAYLRSDAL
jgi:hypothetical protein